MMRNRWKRSIALLLTFIIIVLAAPYFAPYNPEGGTSVSPTRNQPPSFAHPMGTDPTDRDLFSRVLHGSQTSVIVAVCAVAITLALGAGYGMIAAMSGGSVETIMMRVIDICLSVPRFLVLLAVTSIVDTRFTVTQLVLLIALTGWFDIARITRGEVSALLSRDWVLAARATGTTAVRIATHHIFPHLLPILVVVATLGIGRTVVLEAGLSFLGAGSSGLSLGLLIHDGFNPLGGRWWLTIFPGVALALIVLACNALGDALRDVFAPEQVHAWPTT